MNLRGLYLGQILTTVMLDTKVPYLSECSDPKVLGKYELPNLHWCLVHCRSRLCLTNVLLLFNRNNIQVPLTYFNVDLKYSTATAATREERCFHR
jgi:hypothetical protein